MVIIHVLLAWLLADFITGVVHWYEEKYMEGPYRFNWVQTMYEDNQLHHTKPTAICQYSWWGNSKISVIFAAPVAATLFYFDFHIILWLGVFFTSFGNLVHRWAHDPYVKIPWFAKVMQKTGLFITANHHDGHHRHDGVLIDKEASTIRYCPMTNWVNPVLDYLEFWAIIEDILDLCRFRKSKGNDDGK
jgi:plasmanylethanolamine desaturase